MYLSETKDIPHTLRAGRVCLGSVVLGSLLVVFLLPPIAQNNEYHAFADQRTFFGVPAFLNVASNAGFLIVGILGLMSCFSMPRGRSRAAWITLFVGISFITFGSAYYHFAPGSWPLVWDRLPMTVGFMGLVVALVTEYIDERLGIFLIPALMLGASSIIYWYLTDDLRFYIWVQALPLLAIPVLIFLFPPKFSDQWLLFGALGFYLLAKAAEYYDRAIFAATGDAISGHTLKHVLSAVGCGAIVIMLRKRKTLTEKSMLLEALAAGR
jgi:hypothetical protein